MHRNKAHNYCKFKRQISWCVVRQGYGTLDSWLSSWSSWNNNKRDHNSAIPRPTVKKKKTRQWNKEKDIPVPWTRKITHSSKGPLNIHQGGRGDGGGSNGFQGGRKGGSFEYNRTLWGDQVNFIVTTKSSDPPPPLPPPSSAHELTIKTWAFLRYFSLNEQQNIRTVCQRSEKIALKWMRFKYKEISMFVSTWLFAPSSHSSSKTSR